MTTVQAKLDASLTAVRSAMAPLLMSDISRLEQLCYFIDQYGLCYNFHLPGNAIVACVEWDAVAGLYVTHIERGERFCSAEMTWCYPDGETLGRSFFAVDREDGSMLELDESEPWQPTTVLRWITDGIEALETATTLG